MHSISVSHVFSQPRCVWIGYFINLIHTTLLDILVNTFQFHSLLFIHYQFAFIYKELFIVFQYGILSYSIYSCYSTVCQANYHVNHPYSVSVIVYKDHIHHLLFLSSTSVKPCPCPNVSQQYVRQIMHITKFCQLYCRRPCSSPQSLSSVRQKAKFITSKFCQPYGRRPCSSPQSLSSVRQKAKFIISKFCQPFGRRPCSSPLSLSSVRQKAKFIISKFCQPFGRRPCSSPLSLSAPSSP